MTRLLCKRCRRSTRTEVDPTDITDSGGDPDLPVIVVPAAGDIVDEDGWIVCTRKDCVAPGEVDAYLADGRAARAVMERMWPGITDSGGPFG